MTDHPTYNTSTVGQHSIDSDRRDYPNSVYLSSQSTPDNEKRSGREHDEDVMIAVHALGSLRHRAPPPPSLRLSSPSLTATPMLSTPASTAPSSTTETQSQFLLHDDRSPNFVSRVADLPIVNTALRAYDYSKANSKVVKFGAEMVESSVLSMTRPICDRLPVDQVNDFACRQLDRLSVYSKSPPPEAKTRGTMPLSIARLQEESAARSSLSANESDEKDRDREDEKTDMVRSDSQSSRANTVWQSVLSEAGGFGVAISTESVRRLKYCLQWLQYATTRVDRQIVALQKCIQGQPETHSSFDPGGNMALSQVPQIHQIKAELLLTIRQVVEIISKYAGGALPEPARTTVRNFVLRLPQRWATANANASDDIASVPLGQQSEDRKDGNTENGAGRTTPQTLKRISANSSNSENDPPNSPAQSGAHKLLMLATESLDMLRNVTSVFAQSLERAENWVERLRVVGIDRQQLDPGDSVSTNEVPSSAKDNRTTAIPSPHPHSPSSLTTQTPSLRRSLSAAEENSTDSECDAPPKKTPRVDPRH